MTSRFVLGLVLASIVTPYAWSQGSAGAGSGAGSGSDEEEEASGSAAHLVAPKDGKTRMEWLKEHLNGAIGGRPLLARAKIAAYVVDLATGAELYAHDADQGMNLASNAKLLTSVAALGTLGSGFRWRTAVYVDDLADATGAVNGNLYVRGRGDPTLSVADLRALADDVAARGVRTVDGDLVLDTGYFDDQVDPPHYADQPKERAGYRAPVASLGVARSAVSVIVEPEPGGEAKVRLDPDAGDYVRLAKHEVKTVPDGRTKLKVEAKPARDHLAFEVTGQIRTADGSWDRRERVDDPARFAGEVFRKLLAERGVDIRHHAIRSGAVPQAAKLVAAHDSAPLSLVIREMNKMSDNYVAESVLKTLGAETRQAPGPATWADGTTAVAGYLAKLGIPPGSYRAENGSGLYGASEVSAHQLVTLLRAAHADFRMGPDLVASLPVGGQDGTLAKRWHGHEAAGRVRAKTGTLDKVVTLAGYVGVDGGHLLAFAILVNDIPAGQRNPTRAMADEMIDALVAYLDAR
ncbi:MAG: D-alanyl-D-alanine carboxypeptidase/D-alanyl-D-alanine-endopeptidase [Acidobacteriota bacterium]